MYYLMAVLVGLVGGVTSGLFGVGGGIVMVPAMVFFMKTDIKLAVGTSLAVIIPTAAMGVYKHSQVQNVDWKLALSLIPAAIVGGYLGATLLRELSSDTLRKAFGALVIFAGINLILKK